MSLILLYLFLSVINIGELEILIKNCAGLPVDKKIEIISTKFMDTPFKESSIGEGDGIDSDPIVNLEFVDCIAFVEYIMAFINSNNYNDFLEHILNLRYLNKEVDFYSRLHLPDFQWFPNAIQKGYIIDITEVVGKKYFKKFKKTIKTDFSIKNHKISKSKLLIEEAEINYIPREYVFKVFDDIPEYSMIRILRKDSHRPYVTTHVGLVIKKASKKYLRHSSRHFGGKVTDTPLWVYFSTFEKYENWEALGIALYKINDIVKTE